MIDKSMQEQMRQVYSALLEKGYNPIQQITGYILSDDPTYITNHKDVRKLVARMDRDALLLDMVEHFFSVEK